MAIYNGSGFLSKQLLSILNHRSLLCTVSPRQSVSEMVDRMCKNNVGSLVVVTSSTNEHVDSTGREGSTNSASSSGSSSSMNENEVLGIVTERDYLKKMKGRCGHTTLVQDIMTSSVKTVSADCSIADCMEIMIDGDFRHVPVMAPRVDGGGEFIGVVSMRDVVRALVSEHKNENAYLKNQLDKLANAVGGMRH